jgi:hypothetical protein
MFLPVPISRRVRSETWTQLQSAIARRADARMTDQSRERMAADGRVLPPTMGIQSLKFARLRLAARDPLATFMLLQGRPPRALAIHSKETFTR